MAFHSRELLENAFTNLAVLLLLPRLWHSSLVPRSLQSSPCPRLESFLSHHRRQLHALCSWVQDRLSENDSTLTRSFLFLHPESCSLSSSSSGLGIRGNDYWFRNFAATPIELVTPVRFSPT